MDLRAQTALPRTIEVDCSAVKGPRSMVYQQCVDAGRVAEGLRADWQAQLKVCKDAIGFKYLRCHGVLSDDLGVYHEDAAGNPVYNWQYIDMVYDYLLSIHVRPFVGLDFMPDDLASVRSGTVNPPPNDPAHPELKRRVTLLWWKANVTPPKSYARWDALIAALVRHWTDRYGADEVSQWYFDIWNEPNLTAFFSPTNEADRQKEYFELYAHTARAVKSVNAAYRVGGPAAAGVAWIPELIAYCTANQVPLDFISFHCYGVAKAPLQKSSKLVGSSLDALRPGEKSNAPPVWVMDGTALADHLNSQKAVIVKSSMPKLPVEVTEWGPSYSRDDPVHDSFYDAPYILEQLKHTETLDAMAYWAFTDILEESGPPITPFQGGFGLINLQGIKKPAFFAFSFLNQLGEDELVNDDAHSWVARDKSGGVQALFWDLTDPRGDSQADDWTFFGRLIVARPKGDVTLKLHNLKPNATYHLSVSRVGNGKNDAYSAYLKMGRPSQLTPAQVAELKGQATGAPEEQHDITTDMSGSWKADFPINEDDVVLVKLTPAS